MGRIAAEERTIAGITKTMYYTYNLDGSLASITYPSGRVLSYGYSNAARPLSLVDSGNSINYATSAAYAPQGALASVVNGYVSGGFGGITTSDNYNSRLLPTSLSASSSNGTALSLSYSYLANGSVNVETNGRDSGRTATYGYDALSRVTSASSQATSGSDCWGQSMTYDRYANLTAISSTKCSSPVLSLSVNTNNQITNSGFSYDTAGDLTADGVYGYGWNAESHLTTANGVTYTYDGDLQRTKKSSGTLYWDGYAETDTNGNTTNEYIFFVGVRIARRDASGNVYYYFRSRLGTTSTITNASGTVCYDADFYPFGGEHAFLSNCSQSFKFAGMENDSETGDYHTLYRQQAPNLGRWLSPDPAGRAAASPANPQSWNMYSYVQNDPTCLVDPSGLYLMISLCHEIWVGGGGPGEGAATSMFMGVGCFNNHLPVYPSDGGGGESFPGVSQALRRLKDSDCAKTLGAKSSASAIKALRNAPMKYADLGAVKGTGGGGYQGFTAAYTAKGVIELNQDVPDPDHTLVSFQGQSYYVNLGSGMENYFGLKAGSVDDDTFWAIYELHELGHVLGGLTSDVDNAPASLQNTNTVLQHCFKDLLKK